MHLIRAYAVCCDCGWELEARNAMGVAAKHHYKTGHEVQVEMTYSQIFGYNPNRYKPHKKRGEQPHPK